MTTKEMLTSLLYIEKVYEDNRSPSKTVNLEIKKSLEFAIDLIKQDLRRKREVLSWLDFSVKKAESFYGYSKCKGLNAEIEKLLNGETIDDLDEAIALCENMNTENNPEN